MMLQGAGNSPFWLYCKEVQARASFFKTMTRTIDTTNCPGWGDLTKLSDRAVENALNIAWSRKKYDATCRAALSFLQAEDLRRWDNGGKAEFQAMIERQFGRPSVV